MSTSHVMHARIRDDRRAVGSPKGSAMKKHNARETQWQVNIDSDDFVRSVEEITALLARLKAKLPRPLFATFTQALERRVQLIQCLRGSAAALDLNRRAAPSARERRIVLDVPKTFRQLVTTLRRLVACATCTGQRYGT